MTGGSGLLGANIALQWAPRYEVIASAFRHPLGDASLESVVLDLTDPRAEQAILDIAPDVIVHCAAATDVDRCEQDPDYARALNTEATERVARAAKRASARLVVISTDSVFDGRSGHYVEADTPGPLNTYARTKLEGERVALACHPPTLVVRTNIFGWNAQDKRSLAEWVLARLENGQSTPGFTDVWFTPILVNDLADILFALSELDVSGVIHVGGATRLSKYDFAVRIAKTFREDSSLITPSSASGAQLLAQRPRDTSLISDKARTMGINIPDIDSGLQRFAQLQTDGWRGRLRRLLHT